MVDKSRPLECSRRASLKHLGLGAGALMLGAGVAKADTRLSGESALSDSAAAHRVALRREQPVVAIFQVDMDALKLPAAGLAAHVRSLINRIAELQNSAGRAELIHLGRVPASGLQPWSKREIGPLALNLNGPEFAMLTAAAAAHRCHISFECFARDADWPGHVLDLGIIIDARGRVIAKQWRASAVDASLAGAVTTIADVRGQFIGLYGEDALAPVCPTDIGNIALLADGRQPLLQMTQVLKGAEILIFSANAGAPRRAGAVAAEAHQLYCIDLANDVAGHAHCITEAGQISRSLHVIDPRGTVLSRRPSGVAAVVAARIDVGRLRRSKKLPDPAIVALASTLGNHQPI